MNFLTACDSAAKESVYRLCLSPPPALSLN